MRIMDFIQTSVFTDDRYLFTGNQLATFWNLSSDDLTAEEMLGITREMNFSETTFVLPTDHEQCIRKVRIFTPGRELPFAGHPTLGTAFVLKRQGIISEDAKKSHLDLGIGPIEVEFRDHDHIQMHQHQPQFLEEFQDIDMVSKILAIPDDQISREWPLQFVSTGNAFLMVPLKSLKAMHAIRLNTNLLLETLEGYQSQELVVLTTETVHADSHVHVRMFAPSMGVLEDPATGSAAGPIGAYLEVNQVLTDHPSGDEIVIEQGHEIHRPSMLTVQCPQSDSGITDVIVGGKVRLTAEGKFYL
ncbi:MAG: PhzF family phenazine biosynthesis protein [Candidatus Odinarchaeota archaeon]